MKYTMIHFDETGKRREDVGLSWEEAMKRAGTYCKRKLRWGIYAE